MDQKKLNIQFNENIPSDNFDNLSLHQSSICVCASAVKEILENSVVTRGEVEEFSQLLIVKDNQIRNVEDKLSELEIKMAVYKEKLNKDQVNIKSKEDLVKSLTLSVDLLKTINEQSNNKISSLKIQRDQLMAQQNTSDELEKVLEELRIANDHIRDKNDMIQKLQGINSELAAEIKKKDVELMKCNENFKEMETKLECREQEIIQKNTLLENNESKITTSQTEIKNLMENNSELVTVIKMKDTELNRWNENFKEMEKKLECREQEIIQKNTLLENNESKITDSQTEIKNLMENNSELAAVIKIKDTELKKWNENFKEMEKKLECREQEIIQKNTLLENNESKITDSQTKIKNLMENNSELAAVIKIKDTELKKWNENFKVMETKLECREQEIIQKNTLLENNESQITDSQTEIKNLMENNSELAAEIKKKDIELMKSNESFKEMETKLECREQELLNRNLTLLHQSEIIKRNNALRYIDPLIIKIERNLFHFIDCIVIGIQKYTMPVKTLTDYQNGFYTRNGSYWIGLERLHRLTTHYFCDLYVQLNDGRDLFCNDFCVDSKEEQYRLKTGRWNNEKAFDTRSFELGRFSIFDPKKLGWWFRGSSSYLRWLSIDRVMVIKVNELRAIRDMPRTGRQNLERISLDSLLLSLK